MQSNIGGFEIQVVRCDNAKEYHLLGEMMLREYGIHFEYTTVYTPEQNGVLERLNHRL